MGQNGEEHFAAWSGLVAGGEGRSKAALVAGEPAFGLPALTILALEEAFAHWARVLGLRPFAPCVAFEPISKLGLQRFPTDQRAAEGEESLVEIGPPFVTDA
jgi:hypothetical protein